MKVSKKSMTIQEIMNMNKLDSKTSIPPGFPPPPPVAVFNAKTEDEYKDHMKRKLLYEQWENSLTLYRMKQNQGDQEGMRQVILRLNSQLKAGAEAEAEKNPQQEAYYGEDIKQPDTYKDIVPPKDIHSLVQELRDENQSQSEYEEIHAESPRYESKPTLTINTQYTTPSSVPSTSSSVQSSSNTSKENRSEKLTLSQRWISSTLYNTLFTLGRRQFLFIPFQVILLVMIIICSAVATVAAGILCGIIISLIVATISAWIIWSYKDKSLGKEFVFAFYLAEFLSVLFAIIGGFSLNGNYIYYVGIPGIFCCIIATVVGQFAIIQQWKKKKESSGNEIV